MRGKYSPTVSVAYKKDQSWHDRLLSTDGFGVYDVDGFDSYGYNKDWVDRAGNHEFDYLQDDVGHDGERLDYNSLYDDALSVWTFDGTRPVKRCQD